MGQIKNKHFLVRMESAEDFSANTALLHWDCLTNGLFSEFIFKSDLDVETLDRGGFLCFALPNIFAHLLGKSSPIDRKILDLWKSHNCDEIHLIGTFTEFERNQLEAQFTRIVDYSD